MKKLLLVLMLTFLSTSAMAKDKYVGRGDLQLNDIADEIGNMDLSDPNALKKLNDLNAKSKDLVNRAKAKLHKELQNAIGYIEYNPVFDENGTIFELSQVRKGVDKPMGSLPAEFGTKKFKNAQVVEDLGFFIGLHTKKINSKLANYISANLLKINEL